MPGVAIPDWELLRHLEALFKPQLPINRTGGISLFHVEDARGEYTALTVDELRQEMEQQPDAPESIRLYVDGRTPFGDVYELGVTLAERSCTSLFISTNEELVTHFNTRVEELVAAAASRQSGDASIRGGAKESAEQPQSLPVATRSEGPTWWTEHVMTPLLVSVIAGVIVVVISVWLFEAASDPTTKSDSAGDAYRRRWEGAHRLHRLHLRHHSRGRHVARQRPRTGVPHY